MDEIDRRTFLAGAALATGALLAACSRNGGSASTTTSPSATEPPHWHYEGEAGPQRWGELDPAYATCSTGRMQSPIDIVNPSPSGTTSPTLAYRRAPANVVNNGHTVQADAGAGLAMTLDGTDYELLQMHFHAPSEHAFSGRTAPVELHFVHRAASGQLAVLGLLVQEGVTNPAWRPFVDVLGTPEGGHAAVDLDWPALVPTPLTTVRYIGSLTTPPCTEGVQWLVARDTLVLGPAQITAFTDAYADNSRPRQPLNGRAVTVDAPSR
ncbi:MAG: carbonic anhydrase [Acidimicrobiales bacterium]